jgi:hypothetical protein
MMLGKLVGVRAVVGLFAASWLALAACAHNVAQNAASGPDGTQKGAKEIKIENGEGKAKGIVTYPGGDRVDWKVFEIPDKKRGTVDFTLNWQPPRPGLQLAFDVFDEWNTPILASKKGGKNSKGRSRTATLPSAKGKYFVRVYAVGRGDAGKYTLTLEFHEQVAGPAFDALKLDIPDPPKLADIPPPDQVCDEFQFDVKNPACKSVCPAAGAPPGWPACKGKCPSPPDVNEPSCWPTMPCPKPPDERVKACKPSDWPPCPDKKNPDNNNPNCRVAPNPVVGRIVGKEVQGSQLVLTVSAGTDQGVAKGWSGKVIRGPDVNDKAVSGGDVTIIRIDKGVTIVTTKLAADVIAGSPYVRFAPPGK